MVCAFIAMSGEMNQSLHATGIILTMLTHSQFI